METNPEIPQHIGDNLTKQQILENSYPDIVNRIIKNSKIFVSEINTFGMVFEDIAVQERILTRHETEMQTGGRHIIEKSFRNAKKIIGLLHPPSTPDFVSVIFDPNGQLIIDEVVDMKSSYKAMQKKEGQPQNTINVMADIVDIINQIIERKDVEEIEPRDPSAPKFHEERIKLLKEIKNEIVELSITSKIEFSDNLKYVVVLPDGEEKPSKFQEQIAKDITLDGRTVKKEIVHSQFSKRDIHKIIDHYAETP